MAVHAIGDGAVRAALDGLEAARDAWEQAARRPRGSSTPSASTTPTCPASPTIGVTASVQPSHAMDDRDLADRAWGARAAAAYRWRDLLDARADLAFGSDAPVAELDPLAGIQAAVHRTCGRARALVSRQQRLAVADAVLGFTAGAAHAVGEHRRRGLLLPGYAADLVVLDTDIIAHPDRIARPGSSRRCWPAAGSTAPHPGERGQTLNADVTSRCASVRGQAPSSAAPGKPLARGRALDAAARTRARSSRRGSRARPAATWRNSPAASWPSLIQK